MTDLLDFVRRMGQDAGGTASALEILLRVTVLLLAAMLVAARPATLVGRAAPPGLDAVACRHAADSALLLGFSRLAMGHPAAATAVSVAVDGSGANEHRRTVPLRRRSR